MVTGEVKVRKAGTTKKAKREEEERAVPYIRAEGEKE